MNAFIRFLLRHRLFSLRFLNEEARRDKQTVLSAVIGNGMELQYAPNLNDDNDIAANAVYQNGLALQFVSKRLKKDPSFVAFAMEENVRALQYAAPSVRENEHLKMKAIFSISQFYR